LVVNLSLSKGDLKNPICRMMKNYFVYILQCRDGSYYTGVTSDLPRRFYEHEHGLLDGCYTQGRRPTKVVFTEEYRDIYDAIRREKQIKGWSRKKKEALIDGDFSRLVKLAKGQSSTGSD